MIERNEKCSCGSTLRCLEADGEGGYKVICIGIGCNKTFPYRRQEDKDLPKFHELADAEHGI